MLDLDISVQAGRKSGVDIHVSRSFLDGAAMFQTATVIIVQGPRLGKKSSSAIENRLQVDDFRKKFLPVTIQRANAKARGHHPWSDIESFNKA